MLNGITVISGSEVSNTCGRDANYYAKYDDSTLKLYARSDETLTCEFTKSDGPNTDDTTTSVDKKYLYRETFDLRMSGSLANLEDSDTYEVLDKQFNCRIGANMFKRVSITSDSDSSSGSGSLTYNFNVSGLEIGGRNTVGCTFMILASENDNVLEDITLTLQRPNVTLYKCTAGYELDVEKGQCVPCNEGTYKNSGMPSCDNCSEPKEYSPTKAGTECKTCNNGYVDDENTICTYCGPGKELVNGSSCEPCVAGTYLVSDTDTSTCSGCREYTFSLEGWTNCRECPDGTEALSTNSTECTLCPAGKYRDAEIQGMNECTPCPTPNWTPYEGSSSCPYQCEGTVVDGSSCTEPLPGFCPTEEYPALAITKEGTILFLLTSIGESNKIACFYNNDSDITRVCGPEGRWEAPDISLCRSEQTAGFENTEITNIEKVEELINDTTVDKVGPQDVKIVAGKFANPKDLIDEIYSDSETDVTDFTNKTLSVMSNLMAASSADSYDQDLKNTVVSTTENIALEVLGRSSDEETSAADEKTNFVKDMVNVTIVKNIEKALRFSIGHHVVVDEDSNIKDVALLLYKDTSLFNMDDNTGNKMNISGSVVGLKHVKKDDSKSEINFKLEFIKIEVPEDSETSKKVVRKCKWYNDKTNQWSDEGCKTSINEEGNVVCTSDHMTSFAVIMSVEGNQTPEWMDDLVLGINIFFCALTLMCTLPFRTFRVRKMTIIQSHMIMSLITLCCCWYLMHLDFDGSPSKSTSCQIVAFLVHYFLISHFAWAFCCTLTLKIQIVDAVKSFGKKNKSLVKKCMLFSYGFPLLLPTLSIIMSVLLQKKEDMAGVAGVNYIREEECWYEDIWVYTFILFPIYVFLVINFACFIRIMRVVGNARRSVDGHREWRVVKAGLALAFTQGLPWVIHPGALTGQAALVMQYVFLVTFGLQGIGLFMFNVLFQEEVLKNLCGLLHVKPPQIFLSVVPKRHSPHTGDTSVNTTSRNSTNSENKGYSNNMVTYYEEESVVMNESDCEGSTCTSRSKVEQINFRSTLNSVTAVDKSIYQDSTYYNELHESSLVTENRYDQIPEYKDREASQTSKTELFVNVKDRESTFNKLKFVGHNRVYVENGPTSPGPAVQAKSPDHKGPPFL